MKERFSTLGKPEKELLFEALLCCIRANSGVGFRGYDQGHGVYVRGARAGDDDGREDGPEMNLFYQMYRELSLHMVDSDSVSGMRKYCAVTWQEFCRLATKYHEARNGKQLLPQAHAEE